jgi:hypothetical protein
LRLSSLFFTDLLKCNCFWGVRAPAKFAAHMLKMIDFKSSGIRSYYFNIAKLLVPNKQLCEVRGKKVKKRGKKHTYT